MKNFQKAVGEWHRLTFDSDETWARRVAKKTLEEAAELYCETATPNTWHDQGGPIAKECADVAITVLALMDLLDLDLGEAIWDRLRLLRHRTNQPARDEARGIT